MSYYMLNGFDGPDGLAGYGNARLVAVSGLGAAAVVFDPAQVYSDWLQQTTGAANAAVRQIQTALNTLGMASPALVVDGVWGGKSSAAFYAWAQKSGTSVIPDCPGPNKTKGSCPTKDGIAAMAAALASGGGKMSMFMTAGLGMAAVIGIGLLAMAAKKKHPEHHTVRAV